MTRSRWVGTAIREARLARNMTQRELAELLGTSVQATTSRYILLAAYLVALGVAAAAPTLPRWRYAVPAGLVVATINVAILVAALPIYWAGGYT